MDIGEVRVILSHLKIQLGMEWKKIKVWVLVRKEESSEIKLAR